MFNKWPAKKRDKSFSAKNKEAISNRDEACTSLLKVDTQPLPRDVKGDKNKSVLFEACRPAKILELEKMVGQKRNEL